MDYTIDTARSWARKYFSLGLNVLPSRMDQKRPAMGTFMNERDNGCPWQEWSKRSSPVNLQLCTGSRWGLAVVELDGLEAHERYGLMAGPREAGPATWRCVSGSGLSTHIYFSTTEPVASRISQGALWKGDGEHSAIEILGDSALAMVPPSIHPKTKRPYRWLNSPWDTVLAPMPVWLAEMCRPAERPTPIIPSPPLSRMPSLEPLGPRYRCDAVRASITDPVALVESWGVRIASRRPNPAGWLRAHSAFREDRHPSAMISSTTGDYWESGLGRNTIHLFALSVMLGIYGSIREAIDSLGTLFTRRTFRVHAS